MKPTRDLEDPLPFGEEGSEFRRRRAGLSFLFFAGLYSSVHRLWIPLGLQLTTLAGSPYARPDPRFLPALWVAWRLRRVESRFGPIEAFLLGGGLGWAAWESFQIATGVHTGWLGLSHAVSALPIGIASVAVYLQRAPSARKTLLPFWVGALVAAGLSYAVDSGRSLPAPTEREAVAPLPLPSQAPSAAVACGATQLTAEASTKLETSGALEILDCGIRPALLAAPPDGRLRLRNRGVVAMNLRLVLVGRDGAERSGWNLLLAPGRELLSPPLRWREGEIARVHSDNRAEAGLALVFPVSTVTGRWHAARHPLRTEWRSP